MNCCKLKKNIAWSSIKLELWGYIDSTVLVQYQDRVWMELEWGMPCCSALKSHLLPFRDILNAVQQHACTSSTPCSSSHQIILAVCLCLAHEAEDVFYSTAVFAPQPAEKAARIQLHLEADTQSLNSLRNEWLKGIILLGVPSPSLTLALPFFFSTCGCMKYLRALRTLRLWVWG